MDRIEDILRRFQPAAASEEIWDRANCGLVSRGRRDVSARRFLMSAAILVVGGVLLYILTSPPASTPGLPQESPDETLRKIEEAIERAGTVRVRFMVSVHSPEQHKSVGFLLLKKGGKVHGMVKRLNGKNEGDVIVVSDGSRLAYKYGEEWTAEELPKTFYGGVTATLARLGASQAANIGAGWYHVVWHPDGCKETLEVSDIQAGKPDGDAPTISYTVQVKGVNYDSRDYVRLWYEPATLKPIKRSFKTVASLRANGGVRKEGGEYTEIYEEYTLDAEIPDDRFRIPIEK